MVRQSRTQDPRRTIRLAGCVVVGLGFGIAFALIIARHYSNTNVSFHGRDYIRQGSTLSFAEARQDGALVRHGELDGKTLYLNAPEASRLMRDDEDPTALYLRRGDGSLVVYSLSGGP